MEATTSERILLKSAMKDSTLRLVEAIAAAATATGSANSWKGVPVRSHFDDTDLSESELVVCNLVLVARAPRAWREAVLGWDGVSQWPHAQWPAPHVSERLACCLYALDFEVTLITNDRPAGLTELAQRRLTALLLAHPVLLHPCLRVRASTRLGDGMMSVAHAVGMAGLATFPMSRHGASDDELGRFANHPCVRWGLHTRGITMKGGITAACNRTALDLALRSNPHQPHLLVSLIVLSKHQVPGSSEHGPRELFSKPLATATETDEQEDELAFCFQAAVGCHIHEGSGRPTRQWTECPEFLQAILERGDSRHRKFLEAFARKLPQMLIPGALRANMTPESLPLASADQVVDGTQRVLRGMVESGISEHLAAAAEAVRTMLALHAPPHCQVEQALAVIRTLDAHGARMTPDDFCSSRTRDTWSQALRIHEVETAMTRTIRAAAATPDAPPTPHRPRTRSPL